MTKHNDEYQYPTDEYIAEDANDMESADLVAEREMQNEQEFGSADEQPQGFVSKMQNGWSNLPSAGRRSIVIVSAMVVIAGVAFVIMPLFSQGSSVKQAAPVQAVAKPVA